MVYDPPTRLSHVRAPMTLENKDKKTDRLIVGHVSPALPAIRHVLRILRIGAAPQRFDAATHAQNIEAIHRNIVDDLQTSEGRPWMVVSFMVVVIVPVIVASLYFFLFASDQFVSELRFAVRGNTEHLPGADALGTVGGLAYLNSSQEVYAIADYIRSRAAVEEVGRTINLRWLFRAGGADWFSRLQNQATGEELLEYWRKMITVSTEAVSGLVLVEARAFTREDAVDIAAAIRDASEALVNHMQQRPREDMVAQAENEVRGARERAAQARDDVAQYRMSHAIVDPLDSARSLIDNVTELKATLISLDVELASAKAAMGANAPSVQTLQAKRDSLNEQIQKLERRITSTNVKEQTSARLMFDYDKVEIRRSLAEQQVALAEKILDQLRTQAHHRQIYVDVIDGPTIPERALLPERTRSVSEIAVGALGLWGVLFLTFAGIRDHAD
jgi:capsular polysaccharide transport system permease protein